jgi:hypothetical protein
MPPLTWRGPTHVVELEGVASSTHECAIMHEPTDQVCLFDMPAAWASGINSVSLPCKHTFHPTALAQHFVYQNMRCPVCRAGSGEAMDLDSSDVPLDVAHVIGRRAAEMHDSNDPDSSDSNDPDSILAPSIDVHAVRDLFSLFVDISVMQETRLMLTSPLLHFNRTDSGDIEECLVHRSLQRIMFTHADKWRNVEGGSVRFGILHPLIAQPILSEYVSFAALLSTAVEAPMRTTATGAEVLARARTSSDLLTLSVDVDITALTHLCRSHLMAHLGEMWAAMDSQRESFYS